MVLNMQILLPSEINPPLRDIQDSAHSRFFIAHGVRLVGLFPRIASFPGCRCRSWKSNHLIVGRVEKLLEDLLELKSYLVLEKVPPIKPDSVATFIFVGSEVAFLEPAEQPWKEDRDGMCSFTVIDEMNSPNQSKKVEVDSETRPYIQRSQRSST